MTEDGCHVHHFGVQLPCNSWGCPICNPKKLKKLRKRAMNGLLANMEPVKGYRGKYSQKLVTLTCPGKEFREKYTPAQAAEMMSSDANNLMRALKREYPGFHYLRVIEPQKDGFPHYHYVIVGESIIPSSIRDFIKDYWEKRYGQGWAHVKSLTRGAKKGVLYVTNYLTKNVFTKRKFGHVFTSSRGALEPVWKPSRNWIWKKVELGKLGVQTYSEDVKLKMPFEVPWVVFKGLSEKLKVKLFPEFYEIPMPVPF